jgi:uncharacterized Tic20 family protein
MTGADSQDSRNIATLVWVLTIFFSFIPGLVVYLVKKDDAYVFDQGKEALNWAITAIIGYFAARILMLVLGLPVYYVVVICQLVFCILGAVAASSGKPYRVPFAYRARKRRDVRIDVLRRFMCRAHRRCASHTPKWACRIRSSFASCVAESGRTSSMQTKPISPPAAISTAIGQ